MDKDTVCYIFGLGKAYEVVPSSKKWTKSLYLNMMDRQGFDSFFLGFDQIGKTPWYYVKKVWISDVLGVKKIVQLYINFSMVEIWYFFFHFFSGAFIGVIVSICIFNVTGITVTQEMSATTRMVLDSVRTIFIWMISLGLKVGKSQMQFFLPWILPPKNEQNFFLLIPPQGSKMFETEIK